MSKRYEWMLMTGLLVGCASATPEGVTEPGGGEDEAAAPDAATPEDDEAKAREILATRSVSIDFEDAPLPTVVNYLSQQTGLNIVFEPEAVKTLEANDVRVNLQVEEIPLQSALNILLEFTGMTMEWKHGVLYISEQPAGGADAPALPGDAAAKATIDAKLDRTKVSPNFTDTPFRAVVQFFRDVSGINILISPDVFADTPEDSLRVNLMVTDVSMRDALSLILDMTNLRYEIRDGVMVITTLKRK